MRFIRSAKLCLSLLVFTTIPAFAQLPTGATSIFNAADVSDSTGNLVSVIPDEVLTGPEGPVQPNQQPVIL